jgi:ABC-type nitrate/sulfonate/bicarbonate transport system substrate-binding protein
MKALMRNNLVAALAVAVLALTGCGGSPSTGANATARISVDPTSSMPALAAVDQGLFAKNGVEVTTQRFLAVQGVDAVLSGQMDFASALDFAVLSRLQTGRIKIVAATATPDPGFNKLIVNNSVNKPSDLAGKKLGTVAGTVQEYIGSRYLAENKVDEGGVEVQKFTDFSEVVAALRTGKIDAGWVRATDVKEATKSGNTKLLADDSAVRSSSSIFLVAGVDFIKQNQKTVQGVLKSLDEGSTYVNTHPDETAEAIAKSTQSDVATLKSVIPTTKFGVSLTKDQLQGLADVQKFAVERKLLKPGADVTTYVDSSALEAVLPEKVKL